MTKPPLRLLDDPEVAGSLRANLQRVQAADPGYDAQRGLRNLRSALQLPAAGPASTGALQLGSSKLLWLSGFAVTTAIGTGLMLLPASRGELEHERARQHADATETARLSESAAQPPRVAGAVIGTSDAPGSERAGVRREIEQLVQIRALLPQRPAAAYELVERSAREFPEGVLREEREALRALALAGMGKHAEASAAARVFLSRYPRSPLRSALEPLTAAKP